MRVVITGIGVLSSINNNNHNFWNNLKTGNSGFKPITLFDISDQESRLGGEISELSAIKLSEDLILSIQDRLQLLTALAAQYARDNADLHNSSYQPDDLGIVLGSTYGYSISDFFMEALKDSPLYVSPFAFTNTVINAPAARISILLKLAGLSSTVACGEASGLASILYGYDAIRNGQCKAVLAGGGGTLFQSLYVTYNIPGIMAGIGNKGCEQCMPFDREADGTIFGEGAGIVVLESLNTALSRKANILAEVKGFGQQFCGNTDTDKAKVNSTIACMRSAVKSAGLHPHDISMISASANSIKSEDKIEAMAISGLFSDCLPDVTITAIKSIVGECLDGSSAIQAAAGIYSLMHNQIPPINGLCHPVIDSLDYATGLRTKPVNNILINGFSSTGQKVSVVLTKF